MKNNDAYDPDSCDEESTKLYIHLGEYLRMLPFIFAGQFILDCPVFIWRHTMKEQRIKVLALLPMELPKEIELDNTLEAMQKFVGGLIECIILSDTGSEVTLVCNDQRISDGLGKGANQAGL